MIIAMVLSGLAMVATGIWNIFPPFNTVLFPPHIITSAIFGILAIIHIWLHWKTIKRYFTGLGRWRILVGVGYAAVVWLGIVLPILVKLEILTL